MRTGLVAIFLLLWQGGGAGPALAEDDVASLARDVRVLEAELRLARKEKVYVVLDGRDTTVRIKAAGLTLKTLPITRWTSWGDAVGLLPRALVRKSTLFEPKRPTIVPEAAEAPAKAAGRPESPQTGIELNALELNDMPARFQLALDQGIRIAFWPEPTGFFSRWWERATYAGWYLTRPFPTVWNSLLGRPYAALYLRVAAQDARALYWVCRDGIEFLVISL
jgi:hypothetical protein